MTSVFNVGVIGLGVGEQHIVGYQALDGVRVTDICDIDPIKLKTVGDRYNIPNRHCNFAKITENPDIDIVSIASYDDWHAKQAINAFQHGKHVMIEKPIALNRKDSEAILRAQQDSGKLISSNLILRQSPRFRQLKNWIDNGDFGDIVTIEGDYLHQILWKIIKGWRGRMDFYCVTYGGGIHMIDLMRWLIQHEVTEVNGMSNKILTRDTPFKFDDTITNLLKFENGTIGRTTSNLGARRSQLHGLAVYGTKKTYINDLPHAKFFHGETENDLEIVKTPYPGIEKFDLLPNFISAIRENKEPDVSAVDIFRVMDVCFACFESLEAKKTMPVAYLI
ncbi:MAG: dehydrogenase [Rhodospirillaceae bacterium]|nr:dehydrogenase [Rhodospirillaceae bacterium]|tara:strand:+ start:6270 stop:7274 length:1005 start_codon:yes stop_codon:yes gene_type:complete